MFSDIIILAGGFGERLWPASKADFPKQFMTLDGGISFLQHSILRSLALNPKGKIIIATRLGLEKQIAKQCNDLIKSTEKTFADKIKKDLIIICEPFAKHTTAPILLSSIIVNKLNPEYEHSLLVLTSDHIIEPVENFKHDAEKAFNSAEKNHVVTFGIPPYEPSTGYGYILTGSEEENNPGVYKITEFKEKPDLETAKKYLAAGNCRWNSGMFAFTSKFFETELSKLTPEISNAFAEYKKSKCSKIKKIDGIGLILPDVLMTKAYEQTPSIAIDKSLAEKTENAYSVLSSFNWDDVGSWDSFEKHFINKEQNTINVESDNCFVYSDIPVALCGVKDLTVVIKNGKALIMKKGSSNLVREVAKNDK